MPDFMLAVMLWHRKNKTVIAKGTCVWSQLAHLPQWWALIEEEDSSVTKWMCLIHRLPRALVRLTLRFCFFNRPFLTFNMLFESHSKSFEVTLKSWRRAETGTHSCSYKDLFSFYHVHQGKRDMLITDFQIWIKKKKKEKSLRGRKGEKNHSVLVSDCSPTDGRQLISEKK